MENDECSLKKNITWSLTKLMDTVNTYLPKFPYVSRVASLIRTCTRRDNTQAVGVVSRFMASPKMEY